MGFGHFVVSASVHVGVSLNKRQCHTVQSSSKCLEDVIIQSNKFSPSLHYVSKATLSLGLPPKHRTPLKPDSSWC